MPEIGRPTDPNQAKYSQVSMAPKSLAGERSALGNQDDEKILNRATGRREQSIYGQPKKNEMGKDEFLKLLTYQMQNQDPMNPMDQGKMTGELAQFSQLEQLSNLNSKFDQVQKNQNIQDKFHAASFVGKKVVTAGASLKITDEGQPASVLFKVDEDAGKVLVRIMDEKNQTVGEIWKEGMSRGSHEVEWDAVTLDGQPAAKGNYKAIVKAWSPQGQEVATKTQATGTVSSVTFDEGEPVLTVDGQKVYLRDVVSFHSGEENKMNDSLNANSNTNMRSVQKMPTAQQLENNLRLNQAPVPTIQQAQNAYSNVGEGIYD